MFTVDTKKDVTAFNPKAKKSTQEPTANVFHFDTEADLAALSGPELLEVFNATARANPDLKVDETTRFSTRAAGEKRAWGLFVRLRALADSEEEETEEAAPKTKAKSEGTPKKKRTPSVRKAAGDRVIVDKEVARGSKVYPPREGSNQAKMLGLISQKGGISVDDFIKEMNKGDRKGKWSRGNAWSALVFTLHTSKGYGIRCKGGILSVL